MNEKTAVVYDQTINVTIYIGQDQSKSLASIPGRLKFLFTAWNQG